MSVPQSRLNVVILNNAQSSSNFPLPPWEERSLQSYCNAINRSPGSRGNRYQEMLTHLNEAVQGQLTPRDYQTLSHNLLILMQKIPNEIKERKNIKEILERFCFFQTGQHSLELLRSLCSHINASVEIRTHIYQEVLELLKSSLQIGVTFVGLESLCRCFTLVTHMMPSVIKKEASFEKITSTLEKEFISLLKSYCLSINREEKGNLFAAYRNIFNTFEEATQLQTTVEELHRLSRHLILITQCMPSGVRRAREIEVPINRIKQHLVVLYRAHFTPLKENFLETRRSSDVLSLQSEIQLINSGLSKEIDPKLKKEVEKCLSFSYQKFLTRSFAEQRHNVIEAPNTSHFSSSSSERIESTRLKERRIYPILSIDGGGIRGIVPATVLVAIERFTQEPIASLFQLIGGTSTGGILTLGLTKPRLDEPGQPEYSAQDLLDLYTQQHAQIFRRNPEHQEDTSNLKWDKRLLTTIFNPKYRAPSLFQEKFGDSCLSSALTDVVITANTHDAIVSKVSSVLMTAFTGGVSFLSGAVGYEPTSIWPHDSLPREVHLFTKQGLKSLSYSLGNLKIRNEFPRRCSYTRRSTELLREYLICPESTYDFSMAYIAKVTSAAPSYFPPVEYNEKWLMDGGVLQNNPSIPCVLEALDRGQRRDSLFMVSLGTGIEPCQAAPTGLESSLTSLWFQTTQPHLEEDLTLRNMLDCGASHRFQYHFESHAPGLDDTCTETIAILRDSGNELVEENTDEIREVCKILRPESS